MERRFLREGGGSSTIRTSTLALFITAVTVTATAAAAGLPLVERGPWGAWVVDVVEGGDVSSIDNVRLSMTGDEAGVVYTSLDPVTEYQSLWLAKRTLAVWSHEMIATSAGAGGVAHHGTTEHIAYVKHGDLYWWKRDGPTVVSELAYKYATCSVMYAELIVRSDGEPSIVFSDGCSLYVVHRSAGIWTKETIEAGVSVEPDAAIDSLGRIHVASWRFNDDQCRYAVRTAPGTWLKETVSGCRASNSIAVDSQNNPHIASLAYNDGFVYLTKDASGWHREIIGDVWNKNLRLPINRAYFTSIDVDAEDQPHIVYCERPGASNDPSANTHTKYAVKVDGAWSYETIDATGISPCREPDLKLDANGVPHVAYLFAYALQGAMAAEWDIRYARPAATLAPG